MTTFAENLKHYREERGLSQQDLAFKIRVGTASIEKYESGISVPDTPTILRLSTVLDIPASELLEKHVTHDHHIIDVELEQLIEAVGVKKAKLILRKAKDFSEEDLLRVMQMLYEVKYEQETEG